MTPDDERREREGGMDTRITSRFFRWFVMPVSVLVVASACSGSSAPPDFPAYPVALPSTTATSQPAPPATTTTVPSEPALIVISPSEDASQIVDDAQEGTTFEFLPGVHRRFSIDPKDDTTFIGHDGAILSGAVVLDNAIETTDGWRFDGIEFTGTDHGSCIDGYEGCGLSQDLFFDDVMMWQVTSAGDLEIGTWFWDGTSILVLDNPTNRRVELSVDRYAFIGDSDDITIQNLIVEKYATPAQSGAVQAQKPGNGDRGARWLVEDVEIRGAHGAGIRTGDQTIVRRVFSHHNGQMGITVSGGTDVLVEDSEFAFNNIAGFAWGWEAGGSKFTRTDGLIIRGNFAHDNTGPGLWTDIDNVDTLYESNRVIDNTGPGIFHEISFSAVIRDNYVEGNGFGHNSWLWGAGILIAASSDVEVHDNVVINNANGITGVQQNRGSGDIGEYLLARLSIHHNTITLGEGQVGLVEDAGDPSVFTDRDILFDFNTYEPTIGRSYRWGGKQLFREGWMAQGQDVNGTWK
jgi:hypothetical protein